MAFQPGEEVGHVDDAVFDDLGITGAEFAGDQGVEHARIGQHQARLIERADQVLSLGRVDCGLAADRGIDLGQQGRRDLNEIDAAQGQRRADARQIPDHAAAERDQRRLAVDPHFQQFAADLFQMGEILGLFAGLQHDGLARDPGGRQRLGEGRQVSRLSDVFIGNDDDPVRAQHRFDMLARIGQQTTADQDVVAARIQIDCQSFDGRFAGGSRGGAHSSV